MNIFFRPSPSWPGGRWGEVLTRQPTLDKAWRLGDFCRVKMWKYLPPHFKGHKLYMLGLNCNVIVSSRIHTHAQHTRRKKEVGKSVWKMLLQYLKSVIGSYSWPGGPYPSSPSRVSQYVPYVPQGSSRGPIVWGAKIRVARPASLLSPATSDPSLFPFSSYHSSFPLFSSHLYLFVWKVLKFSFPFLIYCSNYSDNWWSRCLVSCTATVRFSGWDDSIRQEHAGSLHSLPQQHERVYCSFQISMFRSFHDSRFQKRSIWLYPKVLKLLLRFDFIFLPERK